jgi:phage shock protein PspC (stress-responsive transcriptional regulator)
MERKLYRDETRKVIGGVCAGLADYLNVDVTIVRLIFVAALILHGTGLGIYIILWIVLPRKITVFNEPFVDYTVPPMGTPPPVADPFIQVPPPMPPTRQRSNGALIGGLILITLGVIFLLDQFNIFPAWNFENLWPVILVVVGLGIMISGDKKDQWKKFNDGNWTKTGENSSTGNSSTEQL